MRTRTSLVPLVSLLLAACSGGDASPDGPFYAGRTLEVVVPYGPGGGTDTWTRMIAPHLQAGLGAGAGVAVLNEPGASSVAGANAYVLRRRPDGSAALVSGNSTFLSALLEEPMVRYDFTELAPIVASPVGGAVYLSPSFGIDDPADLGRLRGQLIYGGIAASGFDIVPLLAFELLDLQVQPILGYASKGAARIAFEQGETNIDYQTMPAYLSNVVPLVEQGLAVPMFSFGLIGADGTVARDPSVPDLPTVREVYVAMHGQEPNGPVWDAYQATLVAGVNMAKVLWLHGEAPERAIADLRAASERMISDPAFIEKAKAEVGDYPFSVGEDVRALVARASRLDPGTRAWLKDYLKERFDIDRLGG
ncbi:MAG: hypothetical protein R3E98_08050 [Gemmatimonadota bacterium]|nr:hypothetical protein [Gemmatimonadota bacterium]